MSTGKLTLNLKTVGFLINPIAGMGGRVGLKGTDDMAATAEDLGAVPVSASRAVEMLRSLQVRLGNLDDAPTFRWLTCAAPMGAHMLKECSFQNFEIVHVPADDPTREDTRAAAAAFVEAGADLVTFCGGDGTARDICEITGVATPILGIPSGVKMYSGVFGVSPARTAELLLKFLLDELDIIECEVLDLDEKRYRQGEWVVRLYHAAATPFEPTLTQAAKSMFDEHSDLEVKQDIALQLREEMEANPRQLYILGPGGTLHFVGRCLSLDKTLLGIDAILGGELVARDLNECDLLKLLDDYRQSHLVLSPIGAQGFVLGRGNLQLSPAVIRKIGRKNITLVATPAKLARTPVLRFDTGDEALDAHLASDRYWPVIIGYQKRRMVEVSV